MDIREFFETKISNFNGNNKVIGVLKNGEEVVVTFEIPGLNSDQVQDFTTGMIFNLNQFKEFKNYSGKFIYSKTKNHHINVNDHYVHGGQNIKRWQTKYSLPF